MVAEKAAAVGEAAERLSRHAVRRAGRKSAAPDATRMVADSVAAAAAALSPFHRRVRANVTPAEAQARLTADRLRPRELTAPGPAPI